MSITHAGGLALAVAGWQRLCIDLVTVEPLGAAFAAEAFALGELPPWERRLVPGPAALCAACAAKEAALKWLGCGMRVPLRSVAVAPVAWDGGRGLRAAVRWAGGEVLCEAWLALSGGRVWVVLWGDG